MDKYYDEVCFKEYESLIVNVCGLNLTDLHEVLLQEDILRFQVSV